MFYSCIVLFVCMHCTQKWEGNLLTREHPVTTCTYLSTSSLQLQHLPCILLMPAGMIHVLHYPHSALIVINSTHVFLSIKLICSILCKEWDKIATQIASIPLYNNWRL